MTVATWMATMSSTISRVAARQHDHQRRTGRTYRVDDEPVSPAKTCFGQPKTAEPVVFVRISAGQIEHALRSAASTVGSALRERLQVSLVVRAVRQTDVERTARLEDGVIVLLVYREGEDARVGFKDERVPLPWCTSRSTTAMRSMPRACSIRMATATSLNGQNPSPWFANAWWRPPPM